MEIGRVSPGCGAAEGKDFAVMSTACSRSRKEVSRCVASGKEALPLPRTWSLCLEDRPHKGWLTSPFTPHLGGDSAPDSPHCASNIYLILLRTLLNFTQAHLRPSFSLRILLRQPRGNREKRASCCPTGTSEVSLTHSDEVFGIPG